MLFISICRNYCQTYNICKVNSSEYCNNVSLAEKNTQSFEKSSLSKAAFGKPHGTPKTTVNYILSSKSSVKELKRQEKTAMCLTCQQDWSVF